MRSAFTSRSWVYFDILLPAKLLRVASGRAFDGVLSDKEIPEVRLC
jgi:hypothetical protein